MATIRITTPQPVDLVRTVRPLVRGRGDPTTRIDGVGILRAVRTEAGPVTVRLTQRGATELDVEAWGPGADLAISIAEGLAGVHDDPAAFPTPIHPAIADAWRAHRDVLLTRTDPFPVLIAAILEQRVTGIEARRAWRGIVVQTGPAAPSDLGLHLPPDPERLASLPSWELTRLGVTGRRADTLREAARHPAKIGALTAETAPTWLAKLPGVGPWTIAEVARVAFGDPDAVSVGDFHLPNIVAWRLAGEPRGTDERMLDLLEPYRGQRGRVQVLLEAAGLGAPKYGPRLEPTVIEPSPHR